MIVVHLKAQWLTVFGNEVKQIYQYHPPYLVVDCMFAQCCVALQNKSILCTKVQKSILLTSCLANAVGYSTVQIIQYIFKIYIHINTGTSLEYFEL